MAVAEEQTAGRGRLDRGWLTPRGSGLAATFVVATQPLLSLRAGVAAAEACGSEVRLKWPNDLLLHGQKLGGILVEAKTGGRALVGIGINLSWAPPGAAQLDRDREWLLERLDAHLTRWLPAAPPAVLRRWRELSSILGSRVRVDLPSETFDGVAEDIADDGALIVSGRRVTAGDVLRLTPGGPAAAQQPGRE